MKPGCCGGALVRRCGWRGGTGTGAASVYAAMQGTVMSDDSHSGLIQGGLRVAF
jgi:hypothetical protein